MHDSKVFAAPQLCGSPESPAEARHLVHYMLILARAPQWQTSDHCSASFVAAFQLFSFTFDLDDSSNLSCSHYLVKKEENVTVAVIKNA